MLETKVFDGSLFIFQSDGHAAEEKRWHQEWFA